MRSRSRDQQRGLRLLLVAGALVGVAHVLGPGGPPVYDGLPVPADPYRYVDPPPGVANPGPPLSAHVSIQLVGGGNPPIDLPTGEFPPQAELWLYHGDVNGNIPDVPVVANAEVTITPVRAPSVPLPTGRQFHGNVYAMRVVANGHSLALHADDQATVALRQPKTSAADPQIAVLVGDHWQLLDTHPTAGAGVLGARLPALGDVAILEKTSGFVENKGNSWLWSVLVLVGVAVAAVLVIRITRKRARR